MKKNVIWAGLLMFVMGMASSCSQKQECNHWDMKGVVLTVNDLQTVDWANVAAENGINTIGTHIRPNEVMEFMNSPEGEAWREKMDLCREIRNLMSHTPDVAGEPVVTPAQGVVDALRDILNYVQKPPMAMDYATGVIVAWRGKSPKSETGGMSSRAGFDGLIRKGFIVIIILLATVLDRAIDNGGMVFQTACTCYYIANEGLSILENAVLMDVPVPGAIKGALEIFRKKGDGEEK